MADVAVALLHGRSLAAPLERAAGVEVVATTDEDHLAVAERLGTAGRLVVGLAAVPWPALPELHAEGSATLDAYAGVVSWHALPALHDRLAEVAAPAAASGAHLLVTAPDPGQDTDPSDVMFLREVAQAVSERVSSTTSSIAWRGETRTPTVESALASLVDAHGRRDVVEVPVAPGTGADARLAAAAERLGVRLTTADLGTGTLIELLATVVRTVTEHEVEG